MGKETKPKKKEETKPAEHLHPETLPSRAHDSWRSPHPRPQSLPLGAHVSRTHPGELYLSLELMGPFPVNGTWCPIPIGGEGEPGGEEESVLVELVKQPTAALT